MLGLWTINNSSTSFKIESFYHFSLGVKIIFIVATNKKNNIKIIIQQNAIAHISPLFDDCCWPNYKKTIIDNSMKPSNPIS